MIVATIARQRRIVTSVAAIVIAVTGRWRWLRRLLIITGPAVIIRLPIITGPAVIIRLPIIIGLSIIIRPAVIIQQWLWLLQRRRWLIKRWWRWLIKRWWRSQSGGWWRGWHTRGRIRWRLGSDGVSRPRGKPDHAGITTLPERVESIRIYKRVRFRKRFWRLWRAVAWDHGVVQRDIAAIAYGYTAAALSGDIVR
jgi:hypothetical protein